MQPWILLSIYPADSIQITNVVKAIGFSLTRPSYYPPKAHSNLLNYQRLRCFYYILRYGLISSMLSHALLNVASLVELAIRREIPQTPYGLAC